MLKRFFLSRSTILTLLVLILGAVVVGYLFPQRFLLSPAGMDRWELDNPLLAALSRKLALDHVYTSPWFAVLLALFLISLLFSSWEQFRLALRRTREGGGGGKELALSCSPAGAESIARKFGYLRVGADGDVVRLVKHPWGYWGNFLLHLGIVVAIAASLIILLYERRASVELVPGEVHAPGAPWAQQDLGLLAGKFVLPEAVRLDRVIPEFWPNGHLKQLTTDFTFIDQAGRQTPYSMHVNKTLRHRGIRIFQGKTFGRAFYVGFRDGKGGWQGDLLMVDNRFSGEKAPFKEFILPWAPATVRAKYYPAADRRSPVGENPLLVMQLVKGGKIIDELSLTTGATGKFAGREATLVETGWWGGIIFIDTRGMEGIFFAFVVIAIGGGLSYLCPPRELRVVRDGGGCRLTWRASRFAELYQEEFDRLCHECSVAGTGAGGRPLPDGSHKG
ncbi:MAG: ResB-like family cytochrome C biogenesis protein [Desulfuromonadales bacterium]|nr:MAG: ResB-like family cytochrome C biogenesis protein [Desulfuromonadales bacterium]